MTKPSFGAGVPIDLQRLMETRLLIQSNSGGGKSWALRRLLEQTAPLCQQFVIDPEGEFATLREKHDYIIAAPHDGDAVATPKTAPLLARRLLESGVSAILNIYDLKAHERHAFVRAFLDALINAPRQLWHPVLVALDEAHVFCPEKGSSEAASACIDMATRGRKRGYGFVMATQRLSKLNKDAAAELINKLIGRTGLDLDVRRAAEELGMTPRDAMDALRTLKPGTFYAFGPALSDTVQRVTIGPVQTTHPRPGERIMQAPPAPSKNLLQQLAKLADLQREAEKEAQTLDELRAEIQKLKREAKRPGQIGGITDAECERRVAAALKESQRTAALALRDLGTQYAKAKGLLDRIVQLAQGGTALPAPTAPVAARADVAPAERRVSIERRPSVPPVSTSPRNTGSLRSGAVRILQELAARSPAGYSRAQVGALTGFAPKGGTFNTYLGDLKRTGSIEERDGLVYATEAGIESLGLDVPRAPTSHDEAMARWNQALRAGAFRMLQAVVEAGPDGISREGIADAVGMEVRGGTFNTYLGDLRRNALISERGKVCIANDILFPERT